MTLVFALVLISSALAGVVILVYETVERLFGKLLGLQIKSAILKSFLWFQPVLATLTVTLYMVAPIFLFRESITKTAELISVQSTQIKPLVITTNLMSIGIDFTKLLEISAYVWIAFALLLIFIKLGRYLFFKQRLKRSILSEQKSDCSKLIVVTSSIAVSPFLIGIFKPMIVIPNTEFSTSELAMTIRHETVHYRKHDIIRKFAAELLKCINWFNPMYYILQKRISEISELVTDSILINGTSCNERKEYGNMLLRFAKCDTNNPIICSSLSGKAEKLAHRLELIMTNTAKRKIGKLAAIALSIIAVSVLSVSVCAATAVFTDVSKTQEAKALTQIPVSGFALLADSGKKLSEASVECSDNTFLPLYEMYAVNVGKSNDGYSTEKLAYGNGQTIVLCETENKGFQFDKNQSAVIKLSANFSPEYSNTDDIGELVNIGYIYDGIATELYSGRVDENGLSVDFTADKSGEYQFYLCNACAGLQNYDSISINKL